jgi:hypothetical protein
MPTNLISLRQHYGFERPYNFRVAIPFIISVLILIATAVAFITLFYLNELSIGTYRFYFFAYTTALLAVAAMVSRFPFVSYAILTWCAIELGACALFHREPESAREWITSHAVNLLPKNTYVQSNNPSATYHPLLVYALKPNWKGNPFTYGTEGDASTNSLGLRGAEIGPEQLARPLIFIYGGSTTFDIGVNDNEATWVAVLQRELRNHYSMINFGVSGYSTTHHLIQTALYQGIIEKKPTCAVYYIGWNDVCNAHVKNLDPGYANFPYLLTARYVLPKTAPVTKYSPILRFLYALAFDAVVNVPQFSAVSEVPSTGTDEHLEDIFLEHVRTITAINRSRDIKTVYIGQILNRAKLSSGQPNLFPFVAVEDTWLLQQHFNSILQKQVAEDGATYIDAGIDNFVDHDFVDVGHFSPEGSKKFAGLVAHEIEIGCQQESSQPVSTSALRKP